MNNTGKKHCTKCAIAYALDIFGDRWSLLVIRDLLLRGHKTYGEFLEAGEGIATNVLADRLKTLEAAGIIVKSRDPGNRRKNIYALTEKGMDLAPVILEIVRWSGHYDQQTNASVEMLARIDSDREGLLADLRSERINAPDGK